MQRWGHGANRPPAAAMHTLGCDSSAAEDTGNLSSSEGFKLTLFRFTLCLHGVECLGIGALAERNGRLNHPACISRSETLGAAEVEIALLTHDSVLNCPVIDIPASEREPIVEIHVVSFPGTGTRPLWGQGNSGSCQGGNRTGKSCTSSPMSQTCRKRRAGRFSDSNSCSPDSEWASDAPRSNSKSLQIGQDLPDCGQNR